VNPTDRNATYTDEVDAPDAAVAAPSRFQVERELARGGLGRVLRGFDTQLGREVAIKTLLRTSPSARARFERETRLTARLQHPNIVPVYEGGLDADGLPYFAMRLVHGRTLTEEIAARTTLEARLGLLPNVVAACNAVAYAHHERITHRDLKPDNILVGAYGETVVIDWGLAKDLDAADEPTDGDEGGSGSGSSLTRVGSVVGTPAYMPPEQAAGRAVDLRADVYALGAVLYQALGGSTPYDGAPDVIAAVSSGPPVPLVVLAPGAPRDLVAVVEKAMARDPGARYPDAGALTHELERFLAGRLVDAHHYTVVERAVRLVRRNPSSAGLAFALFALLVGSVVVLGRANRVAERRREEAEMARELAQGLQREERRLLDDATLGQARLLGEHDPYQALLLLDSLSGERTFDGAVRTVAAMALAVAPARRLSFEGEGNLIAAHWQGEDVVAAWGPNVVRHHADGSRSTVWTAPSPVRSLDVSGSTVAWCTPDQVGWASDGGPATLLDRPCAKVLSYGTGFLSLAETGIVVYPAAGPERVVPLDLGSFATVASSRAPDGVFSWNMLDHQLRYWVDGQGLQRLIVPGQVYGLLALGGSQVLLLGEPPLRVASFDGPSPRVRTVDVPVEWLEFGAPVGADVLVAGSEPEVHRVELARGAVERIRVVGRPRALETLPDGSVAVGTDEGHVFRVAGARVDHLGTVAGQVSSLQVSPDGQSLLVGTRHALAVVAVEAGDQPLTGSLGRVMTLVAEPDGALLVGGSGVVVPASPGTRQPALRRTTTRPPPGQARHQSPSASFRSSSPVSIQVSPRENTFRTRRAPSSSGASSSPTARARPRSMRARSSPGSSGPHATPRPARSRRTSPLASVRASATHAEPGYGRPTDPGLVPSRFASTAAPAAEAWNSRMRTFP
jgi:hypothetical protein